MGMSEGVTQTIFFVAAVVLATVAVVMTYTAVQGMSGDLEGHAQRMGERLRTDLRVINDPANVATSPLVVLVKNTGDQALHPALFTVLVNGTAQTDLTVDVLGSADDATLRAAEVARVQVNGLTLGTGDHVVRVVDATGVADEFRFHQA